MFWLYTTAMKFSELLAGLNILASYYDNRDDYHTAVGHSVLYCFETDHPLSPEDVQRLIDLGWRQDVDYDENDEFTVACYEPSTTWEAFT